VDSMAFRSIVLACKCQVGLHLKGNLAIVIIVSCDSLSTCWTNHCCAGDHFYDLGDSTTCKQASWKASCKITNLHTFLKSSFEYFKIITQIHKLVRPKLATNLSAKTSLRPVGKIDPRTWHSELFSEGCPNIEVYVNFF